MSWSSQVSIRIVARIRALLPEDWSGRAGNRFRKVTKAISDFAEEHNVTPAELLGDGVDLGRRKLEGLASHEYAEALKNFAEEEKIRTDLELHKRTLAADVRKRNAEATKSEAEARLAQIATIQAEFELLAKLKEQGIVLHRDRDGNLTALPAPPHFEFDTILERRELKEPDSPIVEKPGEVTLLGEVVGPINHPQKTIVVAPGAVVRGDLFGHVIVISSGARVIGNVRGTKGVEIRNEGSLHGDVSTGRMSIEDGAYFKGGIDITKLDPLRGESA